MPNDAETATRALAARSGDWVLPYWLEHQGDPASPAYVPQPDDGPLRNTSHRERVPVGTLGSPHVATVDPRGLVTPFPAGWSLDWWVGADDRWHLPSREVAVRQALVDSTPVVETSMRVPGGDVVQTVWAFHDTAAGDVLAVELANTGRVPVALAVAVRPYGPDGAADVRRVETRADRILVDGQLAVWLPKEPARSAASNLHGGDVATTVVSGAASDGAVAVATCDAGLAHAAVVLPLAHGTSLRFQVPLAATPVGAAAPSAVPPADAVARGWASHSGRGMRVELPDARVAGALAAARSQILLAAAGRHLGVADVRETAAVVRSLDRCGLHDEADAIVATLPEGQGHGGRLGGDDPSLSATGAALHAAGAHWAVGRESGLVEGLAGPLAAGAHHRPGASRLRRRGSSLGPVDAGWQLRGALDAAAALAHTGEPEAAEEIERQLDDLRAAVEHLTQRWAGAHGDDLLDALDLVVPLALVPADSAEAASLIERIHALAVHEGATRRRTGPAGSSPERTARLAQAELRRGDPAALDRLRWLVETADALGVWPDAVHPRHGGGCGGRGWSPGAAAAVVELVADLLAHVVPHPGSVGEAAEIVVCPIVPDEWLGAGIEVHGMATAVGSVSYAVRWHGERPALLWEVVPHDGVEVVRLTAPGLDPSWSSSELRGDALLAAPEGPGTPGSPPPAPTPPAPTEGESFG